jgi:hypothetical protein
MQKRITDVKAVLEFDLPEEKEEFDIIMAAHNAHGALWDISQFFRDKLKHENLEEAEFEIYEKIRNKFCDILEENQVSLY